MDKERRYTAKVIVGKRAIDVDFTCYDSEALEIATNLGDIFLCLNPKKEDN